MNLKEELYEKDLLIKELQEKLEKVED